MSRVQLLEAEVAVRSVMTAYMAACDQHDADAVANLFEPDAVWCSLADPEGTPLVGREAVRAEYALACSRLTFCVHYLANERIRVVSDEAFGAWSYFEPVTNRGNLAVWTAGRYQHTFGRIKGVWRFRRFGIQSALAAPYNVGWVPTPEVALP